MIGDSEASLAERVASLDDFRKEAESKLQTLEGELDKWLEEMCSAGVELRERLKTKILPASQASHAQAPSVTLTLPPAPVTPSSAEDYKASIEKLLQGSMDALGDKLSGKILAMLNELKTMGGPLREAKMAEIRDAAQAEHVDLAGLFLHEKIESNLGKEGVKIEEKKTKGIGSILDKLRKLKGGTDRDKTG